MPHIDIFDSPFDSGTIAKLNIFESYTEAWLFTYSKHGKQKEIYIFDLFAGAGYDINGVPGSPIRTLMKIESVLEDLIIQGIKVHFHFNEFEPNKKEQKKFKQLEKSCLDFIESRPALKNRLVPKITNKDFEVLFPEILPNLEAYPSLLFLDQNGVKFLKYLVYLENQKQTDFLFFLATTHLNRFGEVEAMKKHIDIDMQEVRSKPFKHLHRSVTEELKKKIPAKSGLMLYPFSIQKQANICGIVFGASHLKAVDHFLNIGWRFNGASGDANYDIDQEAGLGGQLTFLEELKLSKRELFKQLIREKVLSGELTTNWEVINFAYQQGHIATHASECISQLKKEKLIEYKGHPLVSYESAVRQRRVINYKLRK